MQSTISQSAVSLWWSKIGRWQMMVVIVTLAAYFITLFFTGNTQIAAVIAFVAAFVAAFVIAAVIAFVADTTFIVAFVVVIAAVIAAAAAFIIGFVVALEGTGIGKKTIWFSYVVEFFIILIPMLISILL